MTTSVDVGPSCRTAIAAPVVAQLVRSPRSNPELRMPSRVIGGDATGVSERLAVTVDPAVTMFPLVDPSEPLNGSKPVTVKGPPLMNVVYRPRESVTATSEFVVLLTTTPRRGPVASETIPVARPESMSARIINGPPPVTPGPALPSETMTEPCRSEEHTSELQSHLNLVCRLLLEKKKKTKVYHQPMPKKQTRTKQKQK